MLLQKVSQGMVGKSTCSLSARHGGGKSISFFASAMCRMKKTAFVLSQMGPPNTNDGAKERWQCVDFLPVQGTPFSRCPRPLIHVYSGTQLHDSANVRQHNPHNPPWQPSCPWGIAMLSSLANSKVPFAKCRKSLMMVALLCRVCRPPCTWSGVLLDI